MLFYSTPYIYLVIEGLSYSILADILLATLVVSDRYRLWHVY